MKYKSLDKKAITVMRINAFIWLFIWILIYGVFKFINPEFDKEVVLGINIVFSIIFILLLLNTLVFPSIRYQRYKYLITNEMIDVKKGLFIITRTVVPIERVQKLELSNGPIDRHYNLSTIVIYTAAGTSEIKFINNEEAQKITDEINALLKEKINEVK